MSGLFFDGTTTLKPTNGVFLPATGTRNAISGGCNKRGVIAFYWSSSVKGTMGGYLFLNTVASKNKKIITPPQAEHLSACRGSMSR